MKELEVIHEGMRGVVLSSSCKGEDTYYLVRVELMDMGEHVTKFKYWKVKECTEVPNQESE